MKTTDGIDKDGRILHFNSIEERFLSKIDIKSDEECWLWIGSKDTRGYGHFKISGKLYRAHRLAYAYSRGFDIPVKGLICHTCDVRLCCNPNHLYLGDHSSNICDAVTRQRGGFKPILRHTAISPFNH